MSSRAMLRAVLPSNAISVNFNNSLRGQRSRYAGLPRSYCPPHGSRLLPAASSPSFPSAATKAAPLMLNAPDPSVLVWAYTAAEAHGNSACPCRLCRIPFLSPCHRLFPCRCHLRPRGRLHPFLSHRLFHSPSPCRHPWCRLRAAACCERQPSAWHHPPSSLSIVARAVLRDHDVGRVMPSGAVL